MAGQHRGPQRQHGHRRTRRARHSRYCNPQRWLPRLADSEDGRITYGEPQDDGTSTVTYTDSFGHRTLYRANRCGQIFAITDPLGHTTTQQWDRHDHLLSHTDPLGRTTRWNWDATAT
ncbi:RHS repeat domain-containing protein [Streptomyces olivaceoviridis]|uniref:RHS repeat domain-containing protein n=1 Tax=Streptomyces olivaceoviridis TaxID=1921 RepID=UPI0037947A9C